MNKAFQYKGDFQEFVKDNSVFNYLPRETSDDDIKSCNLSLDEKLRRAKEPKQFGEGDLYMHLPTPDKPALDVDDDGVRFLVDKYSYFTPHWTHGRDGKGHLVQHISDPRYDAGEVKFLKVNGENFAEIRFSGQTFAVGKYNETPKSPEGFAWVEKKGNGSAMSFNQMWKNMHEVVIVSALAKSYEGNLFNFRTSVVGEMRNHNIKLEDCLRMFDRFNDLSIHQHTEWKDITLQRKIYSQTPKDIHTLYAKDLHSKLENIELGSLTSEGFVRSLRKLLKEYYEPLSYVDTTKKPQLMEWTTLSTIIDTDYPPIEELVQGMLTPGLTFLAAKPKLGKSFLTLQLAHAVATGTEFLGRKTIQGSVLFIALEDNARRINHRAKIMGLDKIDNCYFTFVSPKLMEGLEEQLIEKANEIGDVKLIVIDTFIRAKSSKKVGGNDAYEEGSFLIDKLQRVLIANDIGCMANTHDRKGDEKKGEDRVNRMIGTTVYQGQDGNWRLDRTRGAGIDDNTQFLITSRDLPEQEYEIKLNDCIWSMVGVAEKGEKHDKLTQNILDCVQILQDEGGDCKTVELIQKMRDCNFIERDPSKNKLMYDRGDYNTKAKVKSMKKRGLLIQGERYASYKVPAIIEPQDIPF